MTKQQIAIVVIALLLPYYLTFLANGEIIYSFTLSYLTVCCLVFAGIIILGISQINKVDK